MKFEVKTATMDDLDNLKQLNKIQCTREHEEFDSSVIPDWAFTKVGDDYMKKRLKERDSCVFIAYVGKKPIGYLIGTLTEVEIYRDMKKFAELETVYVIKSHRGHGMGTEMINLFFDWCHRRQIKRVRTVTPILNIEGINFYKNIGFVDYYLTLETEF
ncbi:MAG: GNAT family N-acetyltransferase [Candidatus Aenigmatarchaeota archaeon]